MCWMLRRIVDRANHRNDSTSPNLREQQTMNSSRLDRRTILTAGLAFTGTSLFTPGVFAELVELIYAFGAERGVVWSEPREGTA